MALAMSLYHVCMNLDWKKDDKTATDERKTWTGQYRVINIVRCSLTNLLAVSKLPSSAYLRSWENSDHITEALICPTFKSWGNLWQNMINNCLRTIDWSINQSINQSINESISKQTNNLSLRLLTGTRPTKIWGALGLQTVWTMTRWLLLLNLKTNPWSMWEWPNTDQMTSTYITPLFSFFPKHSWENCVLVIRL